ncbi:MAG: response regulator [Terriglobales bacterium]
MTAPMVTLALSNQIPGPLKRNRVLLVDTSPTKRDLRAESMRKLGLDVDCAADIVEARCWWRADLYNLVLINVENEVGHRDEFCEDVRGATPPQLLAFLVGKPEYLAESPNAEAAPAARTNGDRGTQGDVCAALSAEIAGVQPQRWGIMEACQRISAVRFASDTRARAARERPTPAREPDARRPKGTAAESPMDMDWQAAIKRSLPKQPASNWLR